MNRLFIKIKTDPKLKGTLFEVSGMSNVGNILDQIINSMDELSKENEPGKLQDFQMIRLGSPKRILDKRQTFSQTGIGNNDTILITADPETIMSQGLFDFEALSLENQYVSVQDIRAPLRMPLKKNPGRVENKIIINRNKEFAQVQSELQPANESLLKSKESDLPFDFQPLDFDLPHKKKESGHLQTSKRKSSSASKKNK